MGGLWRTRGGIGEDFLFREGIGPLAWVTIGLPWWGGGVKSGGGGAKRVTAGWVR